MAKKHALVRQHRLEQHVQQLAEERAHQILEARARRDALHEAREQELAEAQARYEARRVRRIIDIDDDGVVLPDRQNTRLGAIVPATHDGPSWGAIAAGFALVAVIGITGVIVYLLVRRKTDGTLGDVQGMLPATFQQAPAPQVFLINAGGNGGAAMPVPAAIAAPAPTPSPSTSREPREDDIDTLRAISRIESQLQANNARAQRVPTSSMLKTYALPWLGDPRNTSQAIRVATSLDNPYKVIVRVVGPPGALAALSFSQTELSNQPIIAPGLSQIPTGDVFIVAAGQPQALRMNPRQVLFARGNLSPAAPTGAVVLSISATDDYDAR